MIENFDGYQIKVARPPEGLDFNRNFPFEWRTEGEQHGAGPYPASEPEIKALVDFIATHPNINIAITYHTFSRVILRCYSTKADDEMETDDLWVYKKIGEIGTQAHRLPLRVHLPRFQIPSQGSDHRRVRRLDVRSLAAYSPSPSSFGICPTRQGSKSASSSNGTANILTSRICKS